MKIAIRICSLFISGVLAITNFADENSNPIITNNMIANENVNSIKEKISSDLLNIILNSEEEDLIPIYIFRTEIPDETIGEYLLTETGMDYKIYENPDLFDAVKVPEIEKEIVDTIGTTAAYSADINSQLTPVQKAVSDEMDTYITERRKILKREYSSLNSQFINKHVNVQRKKYHISNYTSTIIVDATPEEIFAYASISDVEKVCYFANHIDEEELDYILPQINADDDTGTKSDNYNNGEGYKGSGVKIGIIEASKGRFDSDNQHLVDIVNDRLFYLTNTDSSGNNIVGEETPHATKVTALIVGQKVTKSNRTFEGVAPLSTVYQTSTTGELATLKAFELLCDEGVHIINYSGGAQTEGYDSYDLAIDELIASTKISFVKSAGNCKNEDDTTEITSPGKAINAITVGNAKTKSSHNTALTSYSVNSESRYYEASYLPNKPDISAPGTEVCTIKNSEGNMVIVCGSGTSYSAPIITGILAQAMERSTSLKANPTLAKSFLILNAEPTAIPASTTSNPSVGNYLCDRSGSGLINAEFIDQTFIRTSNVIETQGQKRKTSEKNYEKGDVIRAVLVFGKNNTRAINSSSDMDNLDLYMYKANSDSNSVVAKSISTRNNVEIIEYTIPEDGQYYFQIRGVTVISPIATTDTDEEKATKGVPYSLVWRVN